MNRTRVADVCTSDLLFLEHSVTVGAATLGPLRLRVHGAQRGGATGTTTGEATLERTIVVE